MDAEGLKGRTKAFALGVIALVESLPKTRTTEVVGHQLMRSGTSVGANYRAAARAKSRADFISKMGTVEEECDESIFWMELLVESGAVDESRVAALAEEAGEILAMTVASIRTAKSRKDR